MKLRPEYAHLSLVAVGAPAPATWQDPPVAVAAGPRHAFHAQVTIASVLLNAPSRGFPTVVALNAPDAATIAAFDTLGRRLGASIAIVDMGAASGNDPAWTSEMEARLTLPDALDCDRLVTLETDVVVQDDILGIWSDFATGRVLGGVPDIAARDWKRSQGRPVTEVYVNSGVLLVDCAAWRSERAGALCREWFAGNRAAAQFPLQDSLNAALAGRIQTLDERWNMTPNELRRKGVTNIDQFYGVDTFTGIFHFDGPAPRPWCRWSDPWMQDLYLRYARIVGLPADFWIEARTMPEAVAEARWAERKGDFGKANRIYRKIIDGLMKQQQEARAAEATPARLQ
jgi:lipopolysaccharide biosynthesis glycosyltransferase